MQVKLRLWKPEDAEFCCKVRNTPELMVWFRQQQPIGVKQQKEFIEVDLRDFNYRGQVIEANGKPVGLCAVKQSGEFSIAVLPEFQHKGIATKALQLLIKQYHHLWSEVFVGNPALEFYIAKLGFRIIGVKERAYWKKELGLVDVVKIEYAK